MRPSFGPNLQQSGTHRYQKAIFKHALGLGIRGAAYATILGQFVSFVICGAYLRKSRSFKISRASFVPDLALLKQVMAIEWWIQKRKRKVPFSRHPIRA